MALFQSSIVKKYLKPIEGNTVLLNAFNLFRSFFHNAERQENIRNSKEEQFQEGFLRELFVKILGYTINPEPNFNLTTELKNTKDAKKADGAILKNGLPIAIIELKGTDTTDLNKVEQQAFGYKNNHENVQYVVTSNFEKLRFYVDNAVSFEEFNLFHLTKERFSLLWLLLAKDNLMRGIAAQMKNESAAEEKNVTERLYRDYSAFRKALFANIVSLNPQYDKLLLFKKTQKLIDRFLFVFFAEDRLLLPPNTTRQIIQDWTDLRDLYDSYQPIYQRFNKLFDYINRGHKNKRHDIFAYNGGLFAADKILDSIKIDDAVLYAHTQILSEYNFESEVDVNILGHIFENSLNEIEELAAEIENQQIDKNQTKRKKDGVFYTPKYITKYIVDNTLGKLCNNKKIELQIIDEEYNSDKHKSKNLKKSLLQKLDNYRNWLLGVTICDPACGSGAFLNQALEFLIEEHHYIDELQAKLLKTSLLLSDIENSILERNLFGVDINEESVEIAKLSLWLRVAQPGRKLTSLNENIKCGNSLIDDPEIAGDKAFNWQQQFPNVFANGGFDVVIGNPPYLRVQGLRDNFEKETIFYEKEYEAATGRFDIYVLFIERATHIIKHGGKVSFILPHKFMISDFGEGVRNFLTHSKMLHSIVHFGSEMVFKDASTYTCIIGLTKENNNDVYFKSLKPNELESSSELDFQVLSYTILGQNKWSLNNADKNSILSKISQQPFTVKDIFEHISQGTVSVGDDLFIMQGYFEGDLFVGYSEREKKEVRIEASLMKPLLKGEDIKRYTPLTPSHFIIYPHFQKDGKTLPYEETIFKNKFPLAYQYFLPYKEELTEKKIRYKTNPNYWFCLHRSREITLFEQEKIITPEISLGGNMTIDENFYFHNTKCYSLIKKQKIHTNNNSLLAILNSSLMWFFLSSTGYVLRGGFFTFKTKYLEPFPFPDIDNCPQAILLEEKVKQILKSKKELTRNTNKFLEYLATQFSVDKFNTKLQTWYELSFSDFIGELNQINKKAKEFALSKKDQIEWMDLFKDYQQQILTLQAEIKCVDKEIDQLVYALYGLTEEEIAIIEKSV